jgi:hypothetical protein
LLKRRSCSRISIHAPTPQPSTIEEVGDSIGQGPGTDDGKWHQVAIAVYPSPAAMMTMLALPKYRAAHVHRAAGLARTRLLATQPIADL